MATLHISMRKQNKVALHTQSELFRLRREIRRYIFWQKNKLFLKTELSKNFILLLKGNKTLLCGQRSKP